MMNIELILYRVLTQSLDSRGNNSQRPLVYMSRVCGLFGIFSNFCKHGSYWLSLYNLVQYYYQNLQYYYYTIRQRWPKIIISCIVYTQELSPLVLVFYFKEFSSLQIIFDGSCLPMPIYFVIINSKTMFSNNLDIEINQSGTWNNFSQN